MIGRVYSTDWSNDRDRTVFFRRVNEIDALAFSQFPAKLLFCLDTQIEFLCMLGRKGREDI